MSFESDYHLIASVLRNYFITSSILENDTHGTTPKYTQMHTHTHTHISQSISPFHEWLWKKTIPKLTFYSSLDYFWPLQIYLFAHSFLYSFNHSFVQRTFSVSLNIWYRRYIISFKKEGPSSISLYHFYPPYQLQYLAPQKIIYSINECWVNVNVIKHHVEVDILWQSSQ
jgi:hypothetical protein